jgi:hypothetical protein
MARLVVLNGMPLNAFNYDWFDLRVFKLSSVEALRDIANSFKEIVSYVRHPATVELLSRVLGKELKPNAGLYTYRPGDVLAVVTLKRPLRGAEVTDLRPEDLDVAIVIPMDEESRRLVKEIVEELGLVNG